MMRALRVPAVLFALAGLAAMPVRADDENRDFDRIPALSPPEAGQDAVPGAAAGAMPAPTSAASGRSYVEDALTLWSRRTGLVVPTPATSPDWQNRTSLDGRHDWTLGDDVTASVSDRFNLYAGSGLAIPSRQDFRNDFREGYLTWEAAPQKYLEVGRINVKNGVALGFNPTDFFKTRTLLDQASEDPSVLREDRLGTVMVRGQTLFADGSVSLVFAPKLTAQSAVYTGTMPSLDPMIDRTNGDDRLLVTGRYNLIPEVSSELLLEHASGQTRIGANFSRPIGDAIVAYAEWAGGRQPSLITAAERYGRETGTLPATAPDPLFAGSGQGFKNDVALGGSWTGPEKITVNLEYHYHQAGFSGQDWRHWFAAGAAAPALAGELWYLRAYAEDQQEPMSRQQMFLRADWTDAFVSNLELSAFALVNLYDGSTLAQLSASYFLSDLWTAEALAGATVGNARTEYGSQPQAGSLIFRLARYF